jgi:hypothetical protein
MKKFTFSLLILVFTAFTLSAQVASSPTATKVTKSSSEMTEAEKQELAEKQKKAVIEKQRMKQEQLKKEQQKNEQANNPNAPVATFDKVVHDYGTIEQHGDGNCEFTFTNDGKEPLILSNVRSSCGCTVPTWPRQPILPGQTETIKVKYDTKRVGTINKSISVYSNGKVSPIVLKIKGKVIAKSASAMPEKKADSQFAPAKK